jgi:hypothetical protein
MTGRTGKPSSVDGAVGCILGMTIFRAGEPRTILILLLRGKLLNAAKVNIRDVGK